ncbi:MAG TPA: Hsp33 family molecular chaperone HslO, partial [Desulfobacterales bacterium]|nr:Hsp33 family molecular chaperone HslO [Desulfobacterales bacterium]
MPQADERLAAELEALVLGFPSLGEAFAEGRSAEDVVREVFAAHAPRFLEDRRVEFMCHCNRDRLRRMLAMLPAADLAELRDTGPFPIELRCHNCGTPYEFAQGEIREIYSGMYGKS